MIKNLENNNKNKNLKKQVEARVNTLEAKWKNLLRMTMIKKRTKKENNKVSFQDFGQFLGWGQKKKNLQKIRQEVILQRSQKKDNQNLTIFKFDMFQTIRRSSYNFKIICYESYVKNT